MSSVGPVSTVLDSAALQVILYQVPGDGHPRVIHLTEVIHSLSHLLRDLLLGAARVHGQHVDGSSYLKRFLLHELLVANLGSPQFILSGMTLPRGHIRLRDCATY